MTVTLIKPLAQERSATYTRDGGRSYTRGFIITTDNKYDSQAYIAVSLGIVLGDAYLSWNLTEVDSLSRCSSITVTANDEAGYSWKATAQYERPDDDEDNPLLRSPTYSWDGNPVEIIVDKDINGDAILNSVNDPFDPPVTDEISRPVLSITRNESSFPSGALNVINKVNSDTFLGAAPETLRVSNIRSQGPEEENDVEFHVVNYEFQYNEEGWKTISILNQGLRYLDEGEVKNILDAEDNPVTAAMLLDDAGAVLEPDGTPVFLDFEMKGEINFSSTFNF